MRYRCPQCNHTLSTTEECKFCSNSEKKPTSVATSLFISVLIIGAIGLGTITYIKMVGHPFQFLRNITKGSRIYEVSQASSKLPISNEPKGTITLLQCVELRELLENNRFEVLNRILEDYQKAFEEDANHEYKVFDAFRVFYITLPSYRESFEAWIEFSPEHYAPYVARANYYYAKGWEIRGYKWAKDTSEEQFEEMRLYFAKAVEDAETALNINPKLMPVYEMLIDIYNVKGDDERQEATTQKALDLFPQSFLIRSAYVWGLQPRWGGSYREMEVFAKKAEKYCPINPELTALYGYIYYDQGRRLNHKKKHKEAVEIFTKAISYGDHWRFYKERASTYHYYLKEPNKALSDINRSIALRPTLADCFRLRSRIYYQKGEINHALDDLLAAQRLRPGDPSTRKWQNWAANALLKKGHRWFEKDLNQAIEKYNLSLKFDPENTEAFYWRGIAWYRLDRFEAAMADFKQAISLDPHHFESYRMLDYVLCAEKEFDRIIDYWNQFLELEPDHAKGYLERSGTYYHKKDFANSLKDLEKSCELGNEEACRRYGKYKKS